jgi:hypothetical protein
MITSDAVLEIMGEIVAEYGEDYIYEGILDDDGTMCVYVEPDTECPSCLIGHVLLRLGVNPSVFAYEIFNIAPINFIADSLGHRVSAAALKCMKEAQEVQDRAVTSGYYGQTWGLAFEKAIRAHEWMIRYAL